MFDHVVGGSNDLEKAKRFYDAVLGTLGTGEGLNADNDRCRRYVYRAKTGAILITRPLDGQPAWLARRYRPLTRTGLVPFARSPSKRKVFT